MLEMRDQNPSNMVALTFLTTHFEDVSFKSRRFDQARLGLVPVNYMLAYIDTPRLKMDPLKKCLRLSMSMGIQSSPEKRFQTATFDHSRVFFSELLDAGHDKMPLAGATGDMRKPQVVGV